MTNGTFAGNFTHGRLKKVGKKKMQKDSINGKNPFAF
jgi:hypothetical protein